MSENDSPRVQLLDVDTESVLSRFNIDGPVCVLNHSEQPLDEKSISGLQRVYKKSLANPDLICVSTDLSDKTFRQHRSILGGRFGLVTCGHVLEHLEKPWEVAPNIEWLIRAGGHIRYTGTWVWAYRPYPDDFWRISISGLRVLFPAIKWLDWWYVGTNKNVGIKIGNIAHERKFFQHQGADMKPMASKITDRSMAYLKVEAIGTKA